MSRLQKSIEILADLLTEIDASDFKSKPEKNVFFGVKTVNNIVQSLDILFEKGDRSDEAKAKINGKTHTALKIVKALIGQINKLNSESTAMQLVHAACTDLLSSLGEVAKAMEEK